MNKLKKKLPKNRARSRSPIIREAELNISESEYVPADLTERTGRSIFTSDKTKDVLIHPTKYSACSTRGWYRIPE